MPRTMRFSSSLGSRLSAALERKRATKQRIVEMEKKMGPALRARFAPFRTRASKARYHERVADEMSLWQHTLQRREIENALIHGNISLPEHLRRFPKNTLAEISRSIQKTKKATLIGLGVGAAIMGVFTAGILFNHELGPAARTKGLETAGKILLPTLGGLPLLAGASVAIPKAYAGMMRATFGPSGSNTFKKVRRTLVKRKLFVATPQHPLDAAQQAHNARVIESLREDIALLAAEHNQYAKEYRGGK